ncbi:MAG: hypothetical protein M3P33_00665 [bacterium]|nr:hypothetical protein [bacterium]
MSERTGAPPYLIYGGIFVTVFIIALGVFIYMSQSKTKDFKLEAQKYQAVTETQANTPSPTPIPDTIKITIASPEDNTFVNNSSLKVAGATKPGTTVTITGAAVDSVNETNADGSFAIDVQLREGENKLTITVFDQSGQQKSVTRNVVALVEG